MPGRDRASRVRLGLVLHTKGVLECLGVHWRALVHTDKAPAFQRMSGPFLFYKQGIYRHKYPFLITPSRRVSGMMRLTAFTTAFSFAS